jgi:hypothetical protein
MTTKLLIAMEDSILMVESSNTGWKKVYESLKGTHPQCIAFDPNNPNRAYCGTFGGGYTTATFKLKAYLLVKTLIKNQ